MILFCMIGIMENAYCFNKSALKNIYELNIINSLSEKYVKDMVDYATLDTYIVKIKDDDFYNNKIVSLS